MLPQVGGAHDGRLRTCGGNRGACPTLMARVVLRVLEWEMLVVRRPFRELVREDGVAVSGTAARRGEDTGGGDRGVDEGSLVDGGEAGDCTSTIGEGVGTSKGFCSSAFSDRGSGEDVCSCLRCGSESIMDAGR